MRAELSPELYWAVLTAGFTALLWAPHVAQRLLEMGLVGGFRDPTHEAPTRAPWAQRSIRAHANAVENLVVFATLAIALQFTGRGTGATAMAAAIYFAARVAHYVIYTLGVPWLRAPMFLVGVGCQMTLLTAILH
jgi:uncharacterized MAPEG superfamily protein